MSIPLSDIQDWLDKATKFNNASLNRITVEHVELHCQLMKTQKSIASIQRMLDQMHDDQKLMN